MPRHPIPDIAQAAPQPSNAAKQASRRIDPHDGKARRGCLPTIGTCHSTMPGSSIGGTKRIQQIGM